MYGKKCQGFGYWKKMDDIVSTMHENWTSLKYSLEMNVEVYVRVSSKKFNKFYAVYYSMVRTMWSDL